MSYRGPSGHAASYGARNYGHNISIGSSNSSAQKIDYALHNGVVRKAPSRSSGRRSSGRRQRYHPPHGHMSFETGSTGAYFSNSSIFCYLSI